MFGNYVYCLDQIRAYRQLKYAEEDLVKKLDVVRHEREILKGNNLQEVKRRIGKTGFYLLIPFSD